MRNRLIALCIFATFTVAYYDAFHGEALHECVKTVSEPVPVGASREYLVSEANKLTRWTQAVLVAPPSTQPTSAPATLRRICQPANPPAARRDR